MRLAKKAKRAFNTVFYGGLHEYYDYTLIFVVMFLVAFGLVMVYSTTAYSDALEYSDALYSLKRQGKIALMSIVFMFAISKVDYHFMLKCAPAIGVLVLGALLAVLFLGSSSNGATRWLSVAGNSIQPSEFAKPALIMVLSRYLTLQFKSKKQTSIGQEFSYAW